MLTFDALQPTVDCAPSPVAAVERALREGRAGEACPREALRALLRQAMAVTPQGGSSVLDHCLGVQAWAARLLHEDERDCPRLQALRQRLPWFDGPSFARLLGEEAVAELLNYLAWHDCGKPFVHEVDEQGRSHFPGHAQASADIWEKVGGTPGECEMMRQDMTLHTLSAEGVPTFARHPQALALLVAAVASVQANAEDFGGFESSSYKAKLKHLDRRGRALLRCLGLATPA